MHLKFVSFASFIKEFIAANTACISASRNAAQTTLTTPQELCCYKDPKLSEYVLYCFVEHVHKTNQNAFKAGKAGDLEGV